MAWDRPEVVQVYERWREITDSYDGDRTHGRRGLPARPGPGAALRRPRPAAPGLQLLGDGPAVRRAAAARRRREGPGVRDADVGAVQPRPRAARDPLRRRRPRPAAGPRRHRPAARAARARPTSTRARSWAWRRPTSRPRSARTRSSGVPAGTVKGRDGCRTPLPWTAEEPGHGFTTGTPWLPFGPEATRLAADVQDGDPGSVLAVYRRLLARRRELRAALPREVEWLPSADGRAGVPARRPAGASRAPRASRSRSRSPAPPGAGGDGGRGEAGGRRRHAAGGDDGVADLTRTSRGPGKPVP